MPLGQALRDLPAARLVRSLQRVWVRENFLPSVGKICAWGSPLGFALVFKSWTLEVPFQLRMSCDSVILHSLGARSLSLCEGSGSHHCSQTQKKLLLGWARAAHTSTAGLSVPEMSPHPMDQQCPCGRKPALTEGDICAETRCFSSCSVFLPMYFHDMSRVW